MAIRKAERKKRHLKIGIGGVTGTGKTIGALRMAKGICGDWSKICVIDSENNSADLYAHLGAYSVYDLESYSADAYIKAINEVVSSELFDVMILDSMTHEWNGPGGILEYVEKMAETKTRGNTYTAWKYGTELHNKFVNSWLLAPIHTICTMRKKDDTVVEQINGKATPRKVGLKNIQRDGLDYEFDIAVDIHKNHHCTCDKDRTMLFDDAPPFLLSEAIGEKLIAWSQTGVDAPEPAPIVKGYQGTPIQIAAVDKHLVDNNINIKHWDAIKKNLIGLGFEELPMVRDLVLAAEHAKIVADVFPEADIKVEVKHN